MTSAGTSAASPRLLRRIEEGISGTAGQDFRIDRIEWCLVVGFRRLLRVTVIAWERLRLTPKMVSRGESIVAGPSIKGNRSILSIPPIL
jgi:hypothetical protein